MLRWQAEYSEGHIVSESSCSYVDLNRQNLVRFSLYDGTEQKVTVDLDGDKIAFYRTRTFKPFGSKGFRISLVGWRTKTDVYFILLREDGTTESFSQWNTTPLTYEPEWFNFERP
jgi:hypothetical protein